MRLLKLKSLIYENMFQLLIEERSFVLLTGNEFSWLFQFAIGTCQFSVLRMPVMSKAVTFIFGPASAPFTDSHLCPIILLTGVVCYFY